MKAFGDFAAEEIYVLRRGEVDTPAHQDNGEAE